MVYVSKYKVTPPQQVSRERFYDMLEVLPPARWYRGGHIEWFHVCEYLAENLVTWFGRLGNYYYEFNDVPSLTREQLIDKIVNADKERTK